MRFGFVFGKRCYSLSVKFEKHVIPARATEKVEMPTMPELAPLFDVWILNTSNVNGQSHKIAVIKALRTYFDEVENRNLGLYDAKRMSDNITPVFRGVNKVKAYEVERILTSAGATVDIRPVV